MHRKLGASRDRARRLVTLALAMSDRDVSLDWLRAEVGLYDQANPDSGRTMFERDKRDLRRAGVDIEERDDTYRAIGRSAPAFAGAELDALTSLAGLVADPATGAALGAFAGQAEAYPDVRHDDRLRTGLPDSPASTALLTAVEDRSAVRLHYRRVEGPPRDYELEPWALRQRRGLWYVLAWDVRDAAAKHFRLDRIASDVTVGGPAGHPRPTVLPPFAPPGAVQDVTVRLHGRGSFGALQLGAEVELDGDHDAPRTVTLPAVRDEVALAFALGHDAEVLAPPDLTDERHRRLQLVHDLHALPAPIPPDSWDDDDRTEALDLPRLRRLLALPAWLAERVDVTVEETARAFGIEVGELAEDLDVLRDVVLPGHGDVVDTAIEDDGVITHHVAVTVPLHLDVLSRARVRSLVAAARSLPTRPADHSSGLDGLGARLDGPVVVAVDADDHLDELALLRTARDERRCVTFLHCARGSEHTTGRTLTPTRIDWSDGHAYVGGWDHDREQPRWFRLDRVARVTLGAVDGHREVQLEPIRYVPTGDETELVLRCTHVGSWLLQRTLPTRRHELPDGTVWAVVRTDSPGVVADHVVIAAGEAEIVAPAEHRAAVVERVALQL